MDLLKISTTRMCFHYSPWQLDGHPRKFIQEKLEGSLVGPVPAKRGSGKVHTVDFDINIIL